MCRVTHLVWLFVDISTNSSFKASSKSHQVKFTARFLKTEVVTPPWPCIRVFTVSWGMVARTETAPAKAPAIPERWDRDLKQGHHPTGSHENRPKVQGSHITHQFLAYTVAHKDIDSIFVFKLCVMLNPGKYGICYSIGWDFVESPPSQFFATAEGSQGLADWQMPWDLLFWSGASKYAMLKIKVGSQAFT